MGKNGYPIMHEIKNSKCELSWSSGQHSSVPERSDDAYSHLDISPTSGILNRCNSTLFSILEQMRDEKCMLASPTGFEPGLPP
jgi:hypothetical protein